jgi:hypothetical protein
MLEHDLLFRQWSSSVTEIDLDFPEGGIRMSLQCIHHGAAQAIEPIASAMESIVGILV